MPTMMTNQIMLEMRNRKILSRQKILTMLELGNATEHDILAELTILRVENLQQKIRTGNFDAVMDALGTPVDIFHPCTDNQSIELLQQKNALEHYMLHAGENHWHNKKAAEVISILKKSGHFSQGINYQFLANHEAKLQHLQGADPSQIRNLIFKGLAVTFPEARKTGYTGQVLILEEPALFHSLAIALMREGKAGQAIELLRDILLGLVLTPEDDRIKERMYVPLLLTLAQCYIHEKKYPEAMETCDNGLRTTKRRGLGRYAPDFVHLKAYCHALIAEKQTAMPLLTLAYAGYSLMRRYNKADIMQQEFATEFGMTIDTYGMETIRTPMPEMEFSYGSGIPCQSIGEFIAGLRYEADLKLEELCEGICTKGALSKIENGKTPGNTYHLEVLMERLGRSVDKYFYTFMDYEEFPIKQLRNEIWAHSANAQYVEMEQKLAELRTKKSHKAGVGLQFIKLMEARLYGVKNGYDEKHVAMLLEVLTHMRKKFDLSKITHTRLGRWDIMALNQIAISLCATGDTKKGFRVFEDLLESMDRYIVDEREKMLMYTNVCLHYSKYLGLAMRYDESLEIAEVGVNLDAKHMRLNRLPSLIMNIACCLFETGEKKKSLPYFAQAYYGSVLLGRQSNARAIAKYVDEKNVGICF